MLASQTIRYLIALLFSHLLSNSHAQVTINLDGSPNSAATATPVLPPISYPTADSAGFANNDDGYPNLANYYFILIGVFFLFLIIVFFIVRRARRRGLARQQAAGQFTDHEARHWPGRPWRSAAVADTHREEGFNESGEAPPPYIPGETPSSSQGQSIALTDLSGKPPDYERHLTQEDADLTRPPPMHHPDNRYSSTSRTAAAPET